jgi:hypothetical protein
LETFSAPNYPLNNILKAGIELGIILCINIQDVIERCGQTLSTSSTYQNKKKCPYQYVFGNIYFVSYSRKNA